MVDGTDIFDDATLDVPEFRVSTGVATVEGLALVWRGPLRTGETVTVDFDVVVKPDGKRENSMLLTTLTSSAPGTKLLGCIVKGCQTSSIRVLNADGFGPVAGPETDLQKTNDKAGGLSTTGSMIVPLLILALALLTVGVNIVVVRRKRQQAHVE